MASTHPSPAPGGRADAPVSLAALWFAILAAPLAWSAQELVSYGISSHLCRLRAAGIEVELAARQHPSLVIVTVVTFIIALAGAWVAWRNWRRVRDVRRESNLHPREIHAERSRFMARCALICNVGFIVAFAFTTSEILVAPLCGK